MQLAVVEDQYNPSPPIPYTRLTPIPTRAPGAITLFFIVISRRVGESQFLFEELEDLKFKILKSFELNGATVSKFKLMQRQIISVVLILLSGGTQPLLAQDQDPPAISLKQTKILIDSISSSLNRYYIFPDKALAMSTYVKNQLK